MTVEAPNILRWAELAGEITGDTAALAYADLLDLAVDLYPFELVAERVWRLRTTVAAYNAWYVALAELVDAPLATLDTKLAKAAGPQCEFRTPF